MSCNMRENLKLSELLAGSSREQRNGTLAVAHTSVPVADQHAGVAFLLEWRFCCGLGWRNAVGARGRHPRGDALCRAAGSTGGRGSACPGGRQGSYLFLPGGLGTMDELFEVQAPLRLIVPAQFSLPFPSAPELGCALIYHNFTRTIHTECLLETLQPQAVSPKGKSQASLVSASCSHTSACWSSRNCAVNLHGLLHSAVNTGPDCHNPDRLCHTGADAGAAGEIGQVRCAAPPPPLPFLARQVLARQRASCRLLAMQSRCCRADAAEQMLQSRCTHRSHPRCHRNCHCADVNSASSSLAA